VRDAFLEVVALMAAPAAKAAFIANNGVARVLEYLEAAPGTLAIVKVCVAVLHAATAAGVDIFPDVDLQTRCLYAVAAAMDVFLDHEDVVLSAVTIAACLMQHHHDERALCADEGVASVLLVVLKCYTDKAKQSERVRTIVRMDMLVLCWMIRDMDCRSIGSGVIPMLTRVTAGHVACSSSAAVFMRCTLGVVKRHGTEEGMQQFVDAGGVNVLLDIARLHPAEVEWFCPLTRDVMASDVGRKEMLALHGVDSIVTTIAQAENEQHVKFALAPLLYQRSAPHNDVLTALAAAGAVSVFKSILQTYPDNEFLSLVSCLVLSMLPVSNYAVREECSALVSKARALHGHVM
jgi:hypothetical protein